MIDVEPHATHRRVVSLNQKKKLTERQAQLGGHREDFADTHPIFCTLLETVRFIERTFLFAFLLRQGK